ncbi:MAG: hypothetical protein ACOYJY_01875 [Acutalibacteraceae bacterium]|jgi:hypothetical protein
MLTKKEWIGNWEEPGVIGTRVEIDRGTVTVLWRGGVVLQSGYKAKKDGDGVCLILKETGLRYAGSDQDYAAVTGLRYENGRLHFAKRYPITGESTDTLALTDRSRYGNVDLVDGEILPRLWGEWRDADGWHTAVFKNNVLTLNGATFPIRVTRLRGDTAGECRVVHADPAVEQIGPFIRLTLRGDTLEGLIVVCDAPSITVEMKKK